MNIRTKLILSFTFIALILAVVGGISIVITRQVANDFEQITEVTNPQLVTLGNIKGEGLGLAISSLEFSFLESAGLHAPGEQPEIYLRHRANMENRIAEYDQLLAADPDNPMGPAIHEAVDNIRTATERLIALSRSGIDIGRDESGLTAIGDLQTFESTLAFLLDDAIALETNDLIELNRAAENSAALATFINIIAALTTIAIAIVLGIVIAENIANPLERLKEAALLVGEGRRDVQVDVQTTDEFGLLAGAFNHMVEDLQATTVSRDYVDSILKSMPGTLIVLDSDAKIVTVNPAARSMLHYSEGELLNQTVNHILADEHLKSLNLALFDTIEETVYRTREGAIVPVSFTSSAMHLNDGTTGLVTIALDITERKQAEAERERLIQQLEEANQQLAQANQMKSQFMATVSHELRTPLSTIIGQSGVMLAGMIGEVSERQVGKLQSIYDSAQHLLSLINDILDIERIESGQMHPSPMSMSPASLAKMWYDQHIDRASEKHLQYEVMIDDGLPRRVMGDQKMITQVATNLIGNAIKYTDMGRVIVDVRWLRDALAISVVDTGPGIPANELDLIFEEFHRTESALQNETEGTGLGLSITRRLVRNMGGQISVQSKLGEGSRFSVNLPLEIVSLEEST